MPSRNATFYGYWNGAKTALSKTGMSPEDMEAERQEILRIAGAKPDEKGRYSMKNLTHTQFNTALGMIKQIQGIDDTPEKNSLIHAIKKLGLDEPYLNSISQAQYKKDWQDLDTPTLKKFRYTATTRARNKAKK